MIKIQKSNINSIAIEYFNKIQEKGYQRKGKVRTHFIDNMERIVLSKPEDFGTIINEFNNKFKEDGAEDFNDFKRYMVNQYKLMRNRQGNWLLQKLNIRVCPYCNRSYTFTINTKSKRISPEFDHFYPKSIYPYLALSFYNLIPSCPVCNHIKANDEIDIHPYIEGFSNNSKFRIDKIENCILSDDYNEWEIYFEKTDTKFDKNIKVFGLRQLYNQHKDYISEIVFKARAYNSDVYNSIIKTFKEQGLTEKEMKRIIFGTYLELEDVGLRPLSKLSKDIIEQVGIE